MYSPLKSNVARFPKSVLIIIVYILVIVPIAIKRLHFKYSLYSQEDNSLNIFSLNYPESTPLKRN